jgi:hypothetical protein
MPQAVNVKIFDPRILNSPTERMRHIAGGPGPPIRPSEYVCITIMGPKRPEDRHSIDTQWGILNFPRLGLA